MVLFARWATYLAFLGSLIIYSSGSSHERNYMLSCFSFSSCGPRIAAQEVSLPARRAHISMNMNPNKMKMRCRTRYFLSDISRISSAFTVSRLSSKPIKSKNFGETVRADSMLVQTWLENLYEAVDYDAALTRAGVNMEDDGPIGDDIENEVDADLKTPESPDDEMCEGQEGELTYGEMDLSFFIALLRRLNPPPHSKFVDLGSGRGQLVLAAAKLFPWKLCTGIEIMPEVFEIGQGALDVARKSGNSISPCEFFNADIYKFTEPLADANVVFAYATCFPTSDGETLSRLSQTLAENVRRDSIIITVNKR
jgi:hypothetical protein